MAQFELRKDEIKQAGVEVAYIAAEKKTGMWKPEKFLKLHPVSFPFLLDEDRAVTKAYGLHHRLATDALNIAHPATLVIDQERKILYIHRGDSQTDRAPFEQALAAATKIG